MSTQSARDQRNHVNDMEPITNILNILNDSSDQPEHIRLANPINDDHIIIPEPSTTNEPNPIEIASPGAGTGIIIPTDDDIPPAEPIKANCQRLPEPAAAGRIADNGMRPNARRDLPANNDAGGDDSGAEGDIGHSGIEFLPDREYAIAWRGGCGTCP
jgi:hypothetical protein